MPTWRDTNPVDLPWEDGEGYVGPNDYVVTKESARGGASQRKPLPWLVCFLIAACIMAFAAGSAQHKLSQVVTVPISEANPHICDPNGPIMKVTYTVGNPYTLNVQCAASGIVMTQATPVNP